MPCVKPLTAYLMPYYAAGKQCNEISFKPCPDSNKVMLPCGQCIGCRLEKSRQWAMRCMHEAQLHEHNCFLTLTYDDTHLPSDGSLHHKDFQLFIKRLRKKLGNTRIRYYMVGEYGESFGRPHFHACIFGYDFHDKKLWKRTSAGSMLYRSEELETIWTLGYSSIGDVNFESAAYAARYIVSKQTGKDVDPNHYHYCDLKTGELVKLTPEYNKMSLRPMSGKKGDPGGIGAEWYKKYKTDVYPHDYVVVRGKKMRPPKYYDQLHYKENPFIHEEILYNREKNGKLNSEDNTPERLIVKEKVMQAKLQQLKRNLT